MILNYFKNLSVKAKLIGIVLGISLFSTSICFTYLIVKEIQRIKKDMINNAIINAKLIGEYCVTPLTFYDKNGAKEILEKLNSIPSFKSGVLYNENGDVFARFNSLKNPPRPDINNNETIYKFESDSLIIIHPIIYHGRKYGIIYICASIDELNQIIKEYLLRMILIEIILTLLVFALAYKFQGIISKPILELIHVMNKISKETDYSIRVSKQRSDELGSLYDVFNTMLEQIQIREKERDLAEASLHEINEQFSAFMNQLPGRALIKEEDSRLIYVNQYMRNYYNTDQWIGKKANEYFSEETAIRVLKDDEKALKSGQCTIIESYTDKNDIERIYQTYKFIISRADKPPRLGVIGLDITDLKLEEEKRVKLESQLRQSQKMEAIGTLAGGIAHDFNNILSPIIGYAELLKEDLIDDKEFQLNSVEEILIAALRARNLIQQILTFSRHSEIEFKPIQIEPIIKESIKLIRASIPTTIKIVKKIKNQPGLIKGDPTRIQQIIMNLCTNAYHAMEETGGVLEIEMKEYDKKQHKLFKNIGLNSNRFLQLTIKDTGHGMSEETMERIFEPYFTTKNKSKGTGMGLSIVHGIIKSLGGEITVQSTIGKGTTFEVFLPLIASTPGKSDNKVKSTIQKGSGRILLVEDEEQIIEMEAAMLKSIGYQVTYKTDSVEALKEFKNNPDKFDCVVTDMTMPNITGEELASNILEIRPDIPVILNTGFSEAIINRTELLQNKGIKAILYKPFSLKELARIIREVLS